MERTPKESRQEVKWLGFFKELVALVATLSEDPSTQVGAVITRDDNTIVSLGYNGVPRGVDNELASLPRPDKYLYVEHAERNAIYNALKVGADVNGCTIYIPWCSCADCARAIIQSGITKVRVLDRAVPSSWCDSCNAALCMFDQANVKVEWI